MKQVACLVCGWVHLGLTPAEYNPPVGAGIPAEPRMKCFSCGADYTRFRLARDGDCPDGCTIQSILLSESL